MYANALVSLVPVCSKERERERERERGVVDYTRIKTGTRDNDKIN